MNLMLSSCCCISVLTLVCNVFIATACCRCVGLVACLGTGTGIGVSVLRGVLELYGSAGEFVQSNIEGGTRVGSGR